MIFKDEIIDHWLSLRRHLSTNQMESDAELSLYRSRQGQHGDFINFPQHLRLVETLDQILEHVSNMNSFAVSDWGSIGIASKPTIIERGSEEEEDIVSRSPSLSVVYPGLDRAPLILSDDKEFWSAVFVGHDSTHLAATCSNDNSIHLFDLASGTSKVVYKFQSSSKGRKLLCVIDDRTVACRDVVHPADGVHRVEILSTDAVPWMLKTIVLIDTVKDIYNMASLWTPDGIRCLLVCSPRDHCVQAVEMIGGHVRWECGKSQMGELCGPLSVCADIEDTVYVADYLQNRLYLLSCDDGSVLTLIELAHFGFLRPFYVCALDEYLYVAHLDKTEAKPLISQFM